MKKLSFFLTFLCLVAVSIFVPAVTKAQTPPFAESVRMVGATDSGTVSPASESAEATASSQLIQELNERAQKDITQPTQPQLSKLAAYLKENPPQPLSWHNGLQHAIVTAVGNGLSANIIVLIILFPIITAFISISKHIIGLQGFGIYAPAVLSVAFVSTGVATGIAVFLTVLLSAVIMRSVVKHLKLQYLPRTAFLLWGVSIFLLIGLIGASYFNITQFLTINIFPLLIIILLTENFMETQLMSTQSKAIQLTAETILVAVICSLFISSDDVQQFVISNPEFVILAVAVINIVVGRYSGLRLLEYIRFRSVVES